MPKGFSVMAHAQKTEIPPLPKGGTIRNYLKSPSLAKGDLGGFKNQQVGWIYGKGYSSTAGHRDRAPCEAEHDQKTAAHYSVGGR
jgi:hypothetical protein